MKKNRLKILIISAGALLIISGCNKSEPTISSSSQISLAPTITSSIEPSSTPTITPTTAPALTIENLSMEAYEKFLNNETTVLFDRFMQTDYMGVPLYNPESDYTLSEILSIVTAHYFEYSENQKIKHINYSYIDCGNDGVNELALCFYGVDKYYEDDDSTLVYVLKYINGKLSLCYYYETWARSETTINEYGYYQSAGSAGATNHINEYGLIDKDGNWQFILSISHELDIHQLVMRDILNNIPSVADAKGITGGIMLDSIHFVNSQNATSTYDIDKEELFYTFYIYDDNMNFIDDVSLYTNSIYKEIFDEANVPFITPDEILTLISEKEEMVGATAEIKEGAEVIWNTLSGNMFLDYVGR